jgi:hypothetical protein
MRRFKQLRVGLIFGAVLLPLFSALDHNYKPSPWDYFQVTADFTLICFVIRTYVPNVKLERVLFQPTLILILRLMVHNIHDF